MAPAQTTNSWFVDANGQWTNAANWAEGAFPDAVGAIAYFTNNITAGGKTITLVDRFGDSNIIVGTLFIADNDRAFIFTNNLTAATQTRWTFDDTDGLAEINILNASIVAGRNHTIGGPITINDDLLINHAPVNSNAFFIVRNTISEGAAGRSLTKTGGGIVALLGSNAYSGATTVAGGILRLGNTNALPGGIAATGGTSALVLTNGGVIELAADDFFRALGTGPSNVAWTGSGGFAAFGAARAVNLGGQTQQVAWGGGGFVPDDSDLILGAADITEMLDFQNDIALGAAQRTIAASNGTAAVDGRLSGVLSGTGGLRKTGAGLLELTRTNTFTGGLTVAAGTLLLSGGTDSLATNGAITVSGGNLDLGGNGQTTDGAVSFQSGTTTNGTITKSGGDFDGQAGTVAAVLAGTAGLTKTTTGVLILGSNNSYSGATTVAGGTLVLNDANALPGGIGVTGGTSALILTNSGVLALGAGDFTRGLGTDSSNVVWTGSGGFSASGADRFVNIGGDTQQLTWGSGGFVPDGNALVLSSTADTHTLDFQNDIALGASNRTFQVNNGSGATDGRLSGVLSGAGGFTKTGAGTLELTRTNTFTGGLDITAGTLLLSGGNDSLATNGDITVTAGNLNLGGSFQTTDGNVAFIGGTTTNGSIVKSGGNFDVQGGTIAARLAGSAGLVMSGGGAANLDTNNTFTGDTVINSGTLRLRNYGTLSGTTNILIAHGATNEVNNIAANNTDRINDAARIVSRGGTLRFTNNAAAATAYAETMDVLDLQMGNLRLQTVQAAADGTSTVIFTNTTAAISRSGGATIRIEAPGLGADARNEILLQPGPGLPAPATGGIIPWALVRNGTSGTGADYNLAVTNIGSGGLIGITALTTYDLGSANPAWGAAVNARPTNDVIATATKLLNSLVLDNGVDLIGPTDADRVLNFSTPGGAAVIVQTGGSSLITTNGNFEWVPSFGNNQAIFNTIGNLTIVRQSQTTGIRGTNGFVKTGPGKLILITDSSKDPVTANAMAGDFYINEGELELRRAAAAGATTLRLDGGDLRLANDTDMDVVNNLFVDESGTITVSRVTSGTSAVTHGLSNVTIAAGLTLTVQPDISFFSDGNENYGLTVRDITLLGDATIDTEAGKGTGEGTLSATSINGAGFNLTILGDDVIHDVVNVTGPIALNNLTLGTTGAGLLLKTVDGLTNVAGNVNVISGIIGLNTNITRSLGTGAGQIQLTGGNEAGFSANGGAVVVDLGGDGTGTGTNLVWGTATFNPGEFALNEDDANNVLELMNDIDLNSGSGTVTRSVNAYVDGEANRSIISGDITNSGSGIANFTKNNSGILELTGQLDWNGTTRITAGTLRIGNVTDLPGGPLNLNPGNAYGNLETAGTFTRALGTNDGQVRIVGTGAAGGTLNNSRPGFTARGGDLTVDIGGDGSGTGPELVWNSIFFDPNGAATNNGAFLLNKTTADANLFFWNDIDFNGEASTPERRILVEATNAYVFGDIRNSQAGAFASGLRKLGAGTLILGGSNSYDGATTVAAGTLRVNGSHTGGGLYDVLGGATLGGTGSIASSVLVESNGVLAPGNSIGTLDILGDVSLAGGGILQLELDGGVDGAMTLGASDRLIVTGGLDINFSTFSFIFGPNTLDDERYILAQYGSLLGDTGTVTFLNLQPALDLGYSIDWAFGGNQIALVIPEPSAWGLLLLGAVTIMFSRLRGRPAR